MKPAIRIETFKKRYSIEFLKARKLPSTDEMIDTLILEDVDFFSQNVIPKKRELIPKDKRREHLLGLNKIKLKDGTTILQIEFMRWRKAIRQYAYGE